MNNFDPQYLSIMKRILEQGIDRPDRTGIGSKAIWCSMQEHDMSEGFPITTHRKVSLRIAFEELMWMLRGSSDVRQLQAKNIHIWDGNSTREFLDKRGLSKLPEGHIGKGYGFNIRNFGGDYYNEITFDESQGYYCDDGGPFNNKTNYYKLDNNGTDQLKNLLHGLKTDPTSRRHLIVHYDPHSAHEAALPSCHYAHHYQILDGKLNSSFSLRSWDYCLGANYNWMFYGLLNKIIAKYLHIESGKLVGIGMDVHIYENQMVMAKELINRTWFDLPTLKINKDLNSLDDILMLEYSDIELIGYKAHPDIKNKPKMAI